jgi:hypothetical protein
LWKKNSNLPNEIYGTYDLDLEKLKLNTTETYDSYDLEFEKE